MAFTCLLPLWKDATFREPVFRPRVTAVGTAAARGCGLRRDSWNRQSAGGAESLGAPSASAPPVLALCCCCPPQPGAPRVVLHAGVSETQPPPPPLPPFPAPTLPLTLLERKAPSELAASRHSKTEILSYVHIRLWAAAACFLPFVR